MSKEVLIFTSPTCAPCKAVRPLLIAASAARKFPLRVVEASFETRAEFEKWRVRAVPTILCLDGETEVGRHCGPATAAGLDDFLNKWGL